MAATLLQVQLGCRAAPPLELPRHSRASTRTDAVAVGRKREVVPALFAAAVVGGAALAGADVLVEIVIGRSSGVLHTSVGMRRTCCNETQAEGDAAIGGSGPAGGGGSGSGNGGQRRGNTSGGGNRGGGSRGGNR